MSRTIPEVSNKGGARSKMEEFPVYCICPTGKDLLQTNGSNGNQTFGVPFRGLNPSDVKNLKSGNPISKILDFGIHFTHPVITQFSQSCVTIAADVLSNKTYKTFCFKFLMVYFAKYREC